MSRDPYRGGPTVELRGERWDRDRFVFERERDRYGDERERFDERDRFYSRGPGGRVRESSVDIDRTYERRVAHPHDDEFVLRERRYYEDEPRLRRSPPLERDFDRRLVIEREREREFTSPERRPPGLLRRQSSLDTFDRRPARPFYERDEYGPPARRGEYRPDPYEPIPLPRSRALPPPRIYAERDLEEIRISEPERYGNDEYHPYPERIREREVVRERRRRDRSGSRVRSHHGTVRSSSRSSTTTSSSGSSSSSRTTTVTAKSEYPKKGKTRIPARLVSKRALIDLGYPFEEEGNTIVVQKALGQENIDDVLKLSEDYKKSETEVINARSSAGNVVEERHEEVFTIPPPPPPAPLAPVTMVPAPVAEVVNTTTVIREPSPARSHRSYSTSTTSRTPLVVEARPREFSEEIAVGPLALVRPPPRDERDIKMEIARLEAEREMMRRDRHHGHSHSHSHSRERELVKAERLASGELVIYEEQVEKIEEPRRGVRIEKDKKGPPPGLMKAMLATLT